jgi:hypothetical protein
MKTWYEIEVEVEPGKWAVIRRDIDTAAEARKRVNEVDADHATRKLERACRAVKCTREAID